MSEVFKSSQAEKAPQQDRDVFSQSIAKAAFRANEYHLEDRQLKGQNGEYFTLEDLGLRLGSDFMIGVESMKLKELLKEKSQSLPLDEIKKLNKMFEALSQCRQDSEIDIATDEIVTYDQNGEEEILYPVDDIAYAWTLLSHNNVENAPDVLQDTEEERDELRKLKRNLTAQTVQFNRQIQFLIDAAGDELDGPTLKRYLKNKILLSHQPDYDLSDEEIEKITDDRFGFFSQQLETAIEGARHENWFRDFISLAMTSKGDYMSDSVEFIRSSIEDDVKGIDAYLRVHFVRNDNKIELASAQDIEDSSCEVFDLPVDIAASKAGRDKKFDKIKDDHGKKPRISWPMTAYFHKDDLFDDDYKSVKLQFTPECWDVLDKRYEYRTSDNWEGEKKPMPMYMRQHFVEKDIIEGLRYYLERHDQSAVTKKLKKRSHAQNLD